MSKTFPMMIDVEDIAVGRVMRLLHKTPGVVKFHLDMDRAGGKVASNGDARAHSPNRKPYSRFAIPGDQAILDLLYRRPMLSTELAAAFGEQGRSPKSISSCLHKLKTDGLIISNDDGYVLSKKARDRLRARKHKKR
jgi:hypothetical protein